jgi:hypothetical protein
MKTLKTIFTIAAFTISTAAFTNASAQKVYSCDSKYDVNDDGLWFFVDSKYDAKKKIWFADSKYDADLLIFFVDSQYDAKWNNTSKKYLIY